MKTVFADTSYYIALTNARDEYHVAAYQYTSKFNGVTVTTAWVVTELANHLAQAANRALFLSLLEDLNHDHRVLIIPPSRELFDLGLDLYSRRADKDWSLTDCISFVVMEQRRLTEALTADHHFDQAGFNVLLR